MSESSENVAETTIVKQLVDYYQKISHGKEYEVSLLETLKKEIRKEVIEEVKRMKASEAEETRIWQDSLQENLYRVYDQVEENKTNLESVTGEYANSKAELEKLLEQCPKDHASLEEVKEQIATKAESSEMNMVLSRLNNFVTFTEFDELSEKITKLASLNELNRLKNEVNNLQSQLKALPTTESLQKLNDSLSSYTEQLFFKCLKKEDFEEKHREILSKSDNLDNRIESFRTKTNTEIKKVNYKVDGLDRNLKSKPWKQDLSLLQNEVYTKVSFGDIADLKEFVSSKISVFGENITSFSKSIEYFEKALARFDEVILQKASKDDFKVFKQHSTNFALKEQVNSDLNELKLTISGLDSKNEENLRHIQNLKEQLLNQPFAEQPKKNEDKNLNALVSELEEIREEVKFKADKSEVYTLADHTGNKKDLEELKKQVEKVTINFHQSVAILAESIKTMLRKPDTLGSRNNRRLELLQNCTAILNSLFSIIKKQNESFNDSLRFTSLMFNSSFKNKTASPPNEDTMNAKRESYRRNVMTVNTKRRSSHF